MTVYAEPQSKGNEADRYNEGGDICSNYSRSNASSSGGGGLKLTLESKGGDLSATREMRLRRLEMHSLQHQLSACKSERAAAERAATERQQQCLQLLAVVDEAASQRDEQAELAAGAVAEAEALRRQLQAVRSLSSTPAIATQNGAWEAAWGATQGS